MIRLLRPTRLLLPLWFAGCQEYTFDILDPSLLTPSGPADLATPTREDVIVQAPEAAVDILWVIDNSGSMSEEQDAIARNLDAFMQFFVGSSINFHLGVITTDTENGLENGILRSVAGYRFLTRDTPLLEETAKVLLRVGTGGSMDEKGIDATMRALTMPSDQHWEGNKGFLREDAALHIIVISDEEDSSDTESVELASYLWNIKPSIDTPVSFSSIVGPSPGGCSSPNGTASPGAHYIRVSREVGGMIESICVRDWTPVLEGLGLLAAGLRKEFFLAEVPVPGTLTAWVDDRDGRHDGVDQASLAEGEDTAAACEARGLAQCFGYTYDDHRNAIQLTDWLPPPDAQVHVHYRLLSGLEDHERL